MVVEGLLSTSTRIRNHLFRRYRMRSYLLQACTVARPGLSFIASGQAVELLASCLQSDECPPAAPTHSDGDEPSGMLGVAPHQVMGKGGAQSSQGQSPFGQGVSEYSKKLSSMLRMPSMLSGSSTVWRLSFYCWIIQRRCFFLSFKPVIVIVFL